jgi:hypothetical protein
VRFTVDEVSLEQVLVGVYCVFPPVTIIPPLLHTHVWCTIAQSRLWTARGREPGAGSSVSVYATYL